MTNGTAVLFSGCLRTQLADRQQCMAESMKSLLKCAHHNCDVRAAIHKFVVIRYLGGATREADSKEKAAFGELSGAWTRGLCPTVAVIAQQSHSLPPALVAEFVHRYVSPKRCGDSRQHQAAAVLLGVGACYRP